MSATIAYYGGIVTDGLVLYMDAAKRDSYPGTGTVWNSVARGRLITGSLVNGVNYNSNSGSLQFDGVDDTVVFGNVLNIGLSNWTVSSWINSTTSHFGRIVAKNNSGPDGWWICVNLDGSFGIGIDSVWDNTTIYNYETAGWINVVGVWNRSSFAKVYVNSIDLGNVVNISSKSSTNLQTSFNLRISSRDSGGGYFNGQISNTQIYNRALSATEVLQNYNATKGRFGL